MNNGRYFHQSVANLHWCIASAPLMLHHPGSVYKTLDEDWYAEMSEAHHDWLAALDADPIRLEQALKSEKRLPLGKVFERYISFWLDDSDHFSLLAKNVQLQNEKGTLGEIDFLFDETRSGRTFHMEVACKFYLGYRNSPNWEYWIGPNGNDTLRIKMDKLERQLAITRTEEGRGYLQNERIRTPEPILLMKGFFFHHFRSLVNHKPPLAAGKNYNSGWWTHLEDATEVFGQAGGWAVLPKNDWLSTFHTGLSEDDVLSGPQALEKCRQILEKYRRSVAVVQVFPGGHGWEEASRGFVVPNHWPKRR